MLCIQSCFTPELDHQVDHQRLWYKLFPPGSGQVLAEVRQKYWVIRGRKAIRHHQWECADCRKWCGTPRCATLWWLLGKGDPFPQASSMGHSGPDHFWRHFMKYYLPGLQTRQKWQTEAPDLLVGTLYMIVDPQLPSALWPVGRVSQVVPGSDDQVRTSGPDHSPSCTAWLGSSLIIGPLWWGADFHKKTGGGC